MTNEKMTPLRERMIGDMRIHGMGDKAQKACVIGLTLHFGRAPDRITA